MWDHGHNQFMDADKLNDDMIAKNWSNFQIFIIIVLKINDLFIYYYY